MSFLELIGGGRPVEKPKVPNVRETKTIVIDTVSSKWYDWNGINESVYKKFMSDYMKIVDEEEIYVDVTTAGGGLTYSLMIANVLTRHKGKVTAIVRSHALSGGTLIALACSEIQMSEYASLSSIDPQVWGLPIKKMLISTEPHKDEGGVGQWLRKTVEGFASTHTKDYEKCLGLLLSKRHTNSKLVQEFFYSRDHQIPIFFDEAQNILSNLKELE